MVTILRCSLSAGTAEGSIKICLNLAKLLEEEMGCGFSDAVDVCRPEQVEEVEVQTEISMLICRYFDLKKETYYVK